MDWYDTNGDGWLESAFGDANADGYYDVLQVDSNADGYLDGYAYDTNYDGVFDTFVNDNDEDGRADSEGWDTNQDGVIDNYADDETGWQAVAVTEPADYAAVGPSDGTSTVDVLDTIPTDDLYTRILLDGIVEDINWSTEIWTLPSPW